MSDEKVVRLATVNDTVSTKGAAASELIVQFLRELADSIESGKETAHKAVLIMYEEQNGPFRLTSKGCNVSAVERVGIVHLALHDFCQSDD